MHASSSLVAIELHPSAQPIITSRMQARRAKVRQSKAPAPALAEFGLGQAVESFASLLLLFYLSERKVVGWVLAAINLAMALAL